MVARGESVVPARGRDNFGSAGAVGLVRDGVGGRELGAEFFFTSVVAFPGPRAVSGRFGADGARVEALCRFGAGGGGATPSAAARWAAVCCAAIASRGVANLFPVPDVVFLDPLL